MSSLDSFILIGASIGCLWGLWLLLNFVFDQIEAYHAAWREERRREDAQATEGTGS
jgi:hypothetical protein